MTTAQLEHLKNTGKIVDYKVSAGKADVPVIAKGSTRGNVWKEVDGIKFQSCKEARRYVDLKRLQEAGHITDLKRQTPFELNPNGTHSLIYYSDFDYYEKGLYVVNDVKPFDKKSGKFLLSQLFKKKMKLMQQVHGINILIT